MDGQLKYEIILHSFVFCNRNRQWVETDQILQLPMNVKINVDILYT